MVNKLTSKQEWLELAGKLCRPLYKYWDPNGSLVRFPVRFAAHFSDDDAAFECFSRPLWAMAGLVRNGDRELGRNICSMIKHGVDPRHENYWGLLDDYSQKLVDIPAIAFFLFVNPNLLGEEFDEEERLLLADWLSQVNDAKVWNNNWHFFPLIVNAILIRLNLGGSLDGIRTQWQALDSHYLSDGWYSDGLRDQRDYYIAWGYHFYSLLWIYIDTSMPPDLRMKISTRAEEFAASFKLFFDAAGEAVPFGRSLVYRFAQVSFWSAYKLAGLSGQPDGACKGIVARNVAWWLEQDIFRNDGTLSIGYAYDNQLAADPYSAEGSPYWAFKSFLLLLIPDDSPFWAASIDPPDRGEKELRITGGNFHVSRFDGMTARYPLKQRTKFAWPNTVSIYEKFVYSTRFGFCFERGFTRRELAGADASLALSIDNGPWIARNNAAEWRVHEGNVMSSVWRADSRVSVTTFICPLGPWHVRAHVMENKVPIEAMDCGFSMPAPCDAETTDDKRRTRLENSVAGLCAMAVSLDGIGKSGLYKPPANSNLLYPRVAVPFVVKQFEAGDSVWINGFYGGVERPDAVPKAAINRGRVSISLGEICVSFNVNPRRKWRLWLRLHHPTVLRVLKAVPRLKQREPS